MKRFINVAAMGALALSPLAWAENKVEIGGYGELHYNNIEKPGDGADVEEVDFHRFVLFFGYEFNEKVRLVSELELEHAIAGDGKEGEIELEQAYIEIDLNSDMNVKAGMFLIPIGIINETHEPPTFYGVERNPVEKNIIPATWWESGVMLSGRIGEQGLSYDVALHSGLDGGTDIRGGRQKSANANAKHKAVTGRLKYTGTPGLELAASLQYQQDLDQAEDVADLGLNDDELDKLATEEGGVLAKYGVDDAVLFEAHAVYQTGPISVKALYAVWDIDGDKAVIDGKDEQSGYFLETGYRINDSWGVFARHNQWENDDEKSKEQNDLGVNYWPHEDVVLKFDIQLQNKDAGDGDGFNLGVGYQF